MQVTEYFGPLKDKGFGLGSRFDYDRFKTWIESQSLNFKRSITVQGDILSGNWNGAEPLDLSSFDTVASTGFAMDASAGSAQFNNNIFIGGTLQLRGLNSIFRSGNTTDARVEINRGDVEPQLRFYSSQENETTFARFGISTKSLTFVSMRLLGARDMSLSLTPETEEGFPPLARINSLVGTPASSSNPRFVLGNFSVPSPVDLHIEGGGVYMGQGTPAYLYAGTIYYTSSGTFTKGDYPGLRAIRVKVVGGGGGGGPVGVTAASSAREGGGGGGGGYAESFILVSDLDTTEAVTRGSGGSSGSNGADSVFDTISGEVRGGGGSAGSTGTQGGNVQDSGGQGGSGTGDLVVPGGWGGYGVVRDNLAGFLNFGGASYLGANSRAPHSFHTDGSAGQGFGGGGSGSRNGASQGVGRVGGAGANGIVIVELYY